jgi:hypothetical protein
MGKFSLLTKLALIAIAVSVVDIFLFFAIIRPQSPIRPDEQKNPDEGNINLPVKNANGINSRLPVNVQINATANKSIFSSYEQIILNIELSSNQNLNDVLVEAIGITSRLNRNYFEQSKSVDLQKQSAQKISFSQTLPSCNSCSGLAPGSYTITITADYQGEILATKNINLIIKQ